MEKILKLYKYVDGVKDTPFPSEEEQAILYSFDFNAQRMGGARTASAKLKHRLCLDDLWSEEVYAEFNGERFFIRSIPSSSKNNTDGRYEHELDLYSETEILNHVYFIDAVQGDSGVDVYKSNSTKIIFTGDVNQFAERLNASLSYSGLDFNVVVDEGITSEDKMVSFEDKYIMSALQEIFNIYELPYHFVGRTIHIGYTQNTITYPLKYGHDEALLSIAKNNANYQVINRITGIGSTDNIPYYYPNESDNREEVEASGKKWITPMPNLMPSIYRESEGAEMFYNAKNNTYPTPEGGYYEFENLYEPNKAKEGKVTFENIKPSIVGMTNASSQRIDMFIDFAYDQNDNDEVDSEGNYVHPYFFAKMRKTDGEYGFNLFKQAIESQAMQISFTSGVCGACTFDIGVGEETQKNIVQVDDSGNLKRDENGNVLWENQVPQDRQNDTSKYEVWIALKKEDSTYGQIMPNATQNLKPSTSDTFVILGINMPLAYIKAAEKKLDESLIKYMWMNNRDKFTFSVKFSRIFFTEHPEILEQLNENSRVIVEYNNQQHTLYVDSYSYHMDADSPLPEIEIDLIDTLTIGQNSLQTALDSIKQDILSSIGGGDILKQGLKYFLRKDIPDVAKGKITFNGGTISDYTSSHDFTSGPFGSGYVLKRDNKTGRSYMEIDELYVRLKAYFETLEIKHLSHVGGRVVLSPASMECVRVEIISTDMDALYDYNGDPLYDVESSRLYALKNAIRAVNVYRCYFKQSDDTKEIVNEFAVDDLAQCREFNVKENVSHNVSNQYYWRRVVAVGKDYIDLSADDCDAGSMKPKAGDTIVTIGNKTNTARQHVVFLSSYDEDAPCIKLYSGINSYSMMNKEVTVISPNADKNVFTGKVVIKPGSSGFGNFEDGIDMDKVNQDISNAVESAQNAQESANEAKDAVGNLNNYVDGAFADGIIEESEAQAIEKYINTVNQTKKDVEATYNVLYGNQYLTGSAKTNLLNAKITFFGTVDDLLDAINNAIVDGKATTEEKKNVDNKYNLFNTAYATLSTAIENANKAIQDKVKELAASEAVEKVESQIEDVTNEAKDDLANKLGYSSFSAMVTAAEKGETIISGGHINTSLIEADAIITSALIASAIKTNRLNVNDKFIVEKDGTFKGVEGVLERMSINGALRSPFSYDGFTGIIIGGQKKLVTNNIIVTNPSSGSLFSNIPGGDDYDGFSATIINYDSEEGKAVGSIQLQCTYPIWENGEQTTYTILDAYEGIDIQGFSNGSSFIGWIIKNRFKLSASTVEMVTITTRCEPTEGGTITGGGKKPKYTNGTLVATANSGYTFRQWSDGVTKSSRGVTWDEDKVYVAQFDKIPDTYYNLTLIVSPSGSGTTSGAGSYRAGTEVKISASPNSGYVFSRWSDGDTDSVRYITMNGNKSLTAYFVEYTPPTGNMLSELHVLEEYDEYDDISFTAKTTIMFIHYVDSKEEYGVAMVSVNRNYLAGSLKAGARYRLSFKHFGASGAEDNIICFVGSFGENPSNASYWDTIDGKQVNSFMASHNTSDQAELFTYEFTPTRTSTANDCLVIVCQVKSFLFIKDFELIAL